LYYCCGIFENFSEPGGFLARQKILLNNIAVRKKSTKMLTICLAASAGKAPA